MPKVGSREFPYTKEGMQAAELYSRAVNRPVENMQEGGETKRSFGDTWRAGKERFGSLLSNMRNKKATSPSVEESSPMLSTTDDGRLMSFTYNQDWSGARGIPMSEARKQDAREFVRSFDPSDHSQVGNLQMYINRMIDEGMLQGDKLAEDGMFGRKTEAMLRQLQGKEQEVDVPMLAEQDANAPEFQPYSLDETEVPMQQGGLIQEGLSFMQQNPGYRGHPGYQEGQYGPEGRWMDADEHRRMNPVDYELQGWANLQKEDYLQSVVGEGAPRDDYFDIYEGDSTLAKRWREENPSQVEKWRGMQGGGLIDKVGYQTGGYVPTFGYKKGGK